MAQQIEGKEEEKQQQQGKQPTTVTVKATPEYESFAFNENSDKFLFMSSIKAPFYRNNERSTIDLVVAVDQSGSMEGERIKMVKETVNFIIKNLENEDRLSIVVYDDKAKILLPLTKMDANGKKKSLDLVKKIQATGSTALYDGLITSIKVMQQRNKNEQNSVSSVMLFTDGEANIGPQTTEDIINGLKNLNPNNKFIPKQQNNEGNEGENILPTKLDDNQMPLINTFGFGQGHNETLLTAIAEFGHGIYTYIENTKMIGNVFAQCLGGLISMVAKNIQIKIKTLNGVKINKCLNEGLKIDVIKENEELIVNYSDLQSEEFRDVLWELKIPTINQENNKYDIVIITCDYINLINDDKKETSEIIALLKRGDENECKNKERNYDVDLNYNRIMAAQAMDNADKLGNSGNLKEAKEVLRQAIETIQNSVSCNDPFCKHLVTDIETCQSALKDKHSYDNFGGKMLKMNNMVHQQQRAVHGMAWGGQMAYMNKAQHAMQQQYQDDNNN